MADTTAVVIAQARSPEEMRAHVRRVQEVMRSVMQPDTHYGVIRGTTKPTLYKAGSEVLLSTFLIAVDPEIEDLSTGDAIRYRVRAVGRHQPTGVVVGAGVGEASSDEEKYRWREAVCREEWEGFADDQRRVKYARRRGGGHYTVEQVRTQPADLANTVLKMAKKRAQVDLCLTALAASDIFTQDAEDLPEGMAGAADDAPRGKPRTDAPRRQAEAPRTGGAAADGPPPCTEKQAAMVRARLDESGLRENDFLRAFEVAEIHRLPFSRVDEALGWIRRQSGAE